MHYQQQQFLPLIEQALQNLPIPQNPTSLYDPIRYFMQLPGKRIRPVFVLQVLELYRKPQTGDAAIALSTELFHNFSLVHDDIMDRADLRRGFQTLHKKWDEPTAILAGDALLVLAWDVLLQAPVEELRSLLASFNRMSLAVCEGQQLDMDFSKLRQVAIPEYLEMIDRKTAALIAFSFELGAFLGGASPEDRELLYKFGLSMGRCFQLRDDYLDLFGKEEVTGKKRGGDIANSKLSHPVLLSMDHQQKEAFASFWNIKNTDPEHRIQQVLRFMESAGIPDECERVLHAELEKGFGLLGQLQVKNGESLMHLRNLCQLLALRDK